MLVKIVSAPKSLDLNGIIQVSVAQIRKGIIVNDPENGILYLPNYWNEEDIKKLEEFTGITLEKIPQEQS